MKHALVIEDRPLIAMLIEEELIEYGYGSARTARSERDAIRMAEERCPDLITADDRLSDGSGIAAVRHICRDQAIPVIFITGEPDMIRQSVPDAVILEKPFTHAELRLAIPAAVKAARPYS
jgi:two-component system, response regulator PdtaR